MLEGSIHKAVGLAEQGLQEERVKQLQKEKLNEIKM